MDENPSSRPQPGRRHRGRPTVHIVLSDDERQALERWARRRSSGQALALRCRIVLACAEGMTNVEAARRLGVHAATVGKWRGRFTRRRLEGLVDEPRPGAPRMITDEQVQQVITKTLEETPTDATRWSTRAMARATGMSQSAISRIWRSFGLKPHLDEAWRLSTDPEFIDRVRDVVGLYLNPPEAALVVCANGRSGAQAVDRAAAALPLLPASPQRHRHDDIRHGATSLYTALEVASGKVIARMTRRHRAIELKRFLARIDKEVPADLAVHLMADSSCTHTTPAIQRWLLTHPRFHLHVTPTYSSWLNLVERWFPEPTSTRLEARADRSITELGTSIQAWIDAANQDLGPFMWTRNVDEVLENPSDIFSESPTQDIRRFSALRGKGEQFRIFSTLAAAVISFLESPSTQGVSMAKDDIRFNEVAIDELSDEDVVRIFRDSVQASTLRSLLKSAVRSPVAFSVLRSAAVSVLRSPGRSSAT
jgi:transposase